MEVIILGSGGVEPVPKPCCTCARCIKAAEKRGRYMRTGPSLYVVSANTVIDTPEEIRMQLVRESITEVNAIFYTHWHPDHTMGIRIIEQINKDWHTNTPRGKPIEVYMPNEQLELMDRYLIRKSVFEFYENQGLMKLHFIEEKSPIRLGKISIEAIRFPTSTAVYYLLTEGSKKIIYMPCEVEELKEKDKLKNADCLIAHLSWFMEKGICANFPWSNTEQPVERILEFAKNLSIKSVVFMHIDECHDKTPEELKALEEKYKRYNIRFAYDGMKIKI